VVVYNYKYDPPQKTTACRKWNGWVGDNSWSPNESLDSSITPRTSYFTMRWWPLCIRTTRWVVFC